MRVCLQGGGVFVISGTVTFSSCTITGNTAYYVRAHTQNFPCPRWKFLADMQVDSRRSIGIKSCSTRHGYVPALTATDGENADALALILACTTANDALVNYSRYVPLRPQNSHRPDGENAERCACFDSRLQNCARRFGQLQIVRATEIETLSPLRQWENALLTCPFRFS